MVGFCGAMAFVQCFDEKYGSSIDWFTHTFSHYVIWYWNLWKKFSPSSSKHVQHSMKLSRWIILPPACSRWTPQTTHNSFVILVFKGANPKNLLYDKPVIPASTYEKHETLITLRCDLVKLCLRCWSLLRSVILSLSYSFVVALADSHKLSVFSSIIN